MTEPSDRQPDPPNGSSGPGPEDRPEAEIPQDDELHAVSEAEIPQDDDLYAVSEPEPAPPDLAIGETTPVWFAAAADGRREGPLSLLEMKQRVTSGKLTGESLVWKGGMSVWTPAQQVPELFEPLTASQQSPPTSAPRSLPAGPAAFLKKLDELLGHPTFFRMAGRISAGLALVIFAVSILLWYWGLTWFTGAAIFAVIFLVGEAAGAILEALGRIESQTSAQRESEEKPRQ